MVSKGVLNVLELLTDDFSDVDVIGISGEFHLYVIGLINKKKLPFRLEPSFFLASDLKILDLLVR